MKTEFEDTWGRIINYAGKVFRQVGGNEFTYHVSSTGGSIRLSRTNQSVGRLTFEAAWKRRPLSGPGAINDLRAPSYVFALLSDPRIINDCGASGIGVG